MKKNTVKLNEGRLREIISKGVKKALRESGVYGYDNAEDLAQDLLDVFNYNSQEDAFMGLSPKQSRVLNAVYGFLTTGGFNDSGAYASLGTGTQI